jgi:F-type H+-transporting ATPase subunit gamma
VTRVSELQDHIANMTELFGIVGAMRSLAGMRVLEAQRALPGIRRYAGSMAGAIGSGLLMLPEIPADGRAARGLRALILFTAEHGFVGSFNERLVEAVAAIIAPSDLLFVLGSRGAALARERGYALLWDRPMATRPTSVPETVRALATELFGRIARGELSRVELLHARYRQGGAPPIERRPLLPLELASFAVKRSRQAPLYNLAPDILLERLVSEYVLALLMEAAVESIASENAARFAAMESAHQNVSKKLDQLRRAAQQARQDEITTELLDLVTGAEALNRELDLHR